MPNPKNNGNQPSPADINRFLDLQEADIKVRGQEVVLRGKEIDANRLIPHSRLQATFLWAKKRPVIGPCRSGKND